MKNYSLTIIQDHGTDYAPVAYTVSFSGAVAACQAFGMACRAAMLEPGPSSRLVTEARKAHPGQLIRRHRTNLCHVTVELSCGSRA